MFKKVSDHLKSGYVLSFDKGDNSGVVVDENDQKFSFYLKDAAYMRLLNDHIEWCSIPVQKEMPYPKMGDQLVFQWSKNDQVLIWTVKVVHDALKRRRLNDLSDND